MRQYFSKAKQMTFPLFIRLLLSFVIVIILLLSFHFISFSIMKNKYQNQIVAYNQKNLERTAEHYEYIFSATRNVLLNLYNKSSFLLLNSELQNWEAQVDFHPINVQTIYRELEDTIQSNRHLMLEDIYLVMKHPDSVISKKGLTEASLIFDKYITSPLRTTYEDWKSMEQKDSYFEIFPATFVNYVNESPKITNTYAVAVQNPFIKDYYLIAFINENHIFTRYHHALSQDFWIQNSGQQFIGGTKELSKMLASQVASKENYYSAADKSYFFAQKGSFSGLTYVDQVPNTLIKQEVSRLYYLLIPLLFIALAVSFFISVFFSRHISDPVKQILFSLQSYQDTKVVSSSIKEFRSIHQHFTSLGQKNKEFSNELTQSNSLLKYYALVNKLKAITTSVPSTFKVDFSDRPFIFVVVEVYFKKNGSVVPVTDKEQVRAISFICEFIRHSFTVSSPESITFQMEKHQITSILFLEKTNDSEQYELQINSLLQPLIKTLQLDENSCIFTISTSKININSTELTDAYEEARSLLSYRQLDEQLQLIRAFPKQEVASLSSFKAQELHSFIMSANQYDTIQWVDRHLQNYRAKEATLYHYRELAHFVMTKVIQIHRSINLDPNEAELILQEIEECFTFEGFETLLHDACAKTITQILQRKEDQDELIVFVTEYLDQHFHDQNISLEMIAERSKVTTSYLSTYFKEKTGINFKDYLNNLRLNNAKELLINTDLQIQEVALKVGYQNTNPFIRMFRKNTGMTPGEFRRKSLNKN